MTTDNQQNPSPNQPEQPPYILRRIIIIVIIIVFGIVVARYLINTKQKVSRKPAQRTAALVTVIPLHSQSELIRISARGTVIPAREVVLKTPVGGEIITISNSCTCGGFFSKGETILQIDPRDYELAIQLKQRILSDAEYAYKIEQGRQDVALREWDLLYGKGGAKEKEPDNELALRKPHLEKVQADVKAARAELELAELNLSRTTITAPFNVLVLDTYVDKGTFVAPQEKLADLIGTDAYWVQVSLPLERLQWLDIPPTNIKSGSTAMIFYRQDAMRKGQVLRLRGDLTKEGRMASLLISVPDPLSLSTGEKTQPPLIIGEYVRVSIEGKELQNVYSIPRTALHNDREIWLATADNKLAIRPVEIIWRDETHVLVRDNLSDGDLLIVSNLAVPVDGMSIRIDRKDDKDIKSVKASR